MPSKSTDYREHVLAAMMHGLIVSECLENNRKHLKAVAKNLERMKTENSEARVVAIAAAKLMRAVADALATGEEANNDVLKCLGLIVKCAEEIEK